MNLLTLTAIIFGCCAVLASSIPVGSLAQVDKPQIHVSAAKTNTLNIVSNGVGVLEFLRREGEFANAERPDFILLNLKMPRMDGREVLAEIKSDPALKHIPVVVLTTSSAESDIHAPYGRHANCYITKPADSGQFVCIVNLIDEFCLTTVMLPPQPLTRA